MLTHRENHMSESILGASMASLDSGGAKLSLESTETYSRTYSQSAGIGMYGACGSAELFSATAENKLYFLVVGNIRGLVAHPSLVSSLSIAWRFEQTYNTNFNLDGNNSSYTISSDIFKLANGNFSKIPIGAYISISGLNISCQITIRKYSITI